MINYGAKNLVGVICLSLPLIAAAAVPTWDIIPKQSSLKFTATQNDAPVTGEFKSFKGEIQFDPTQLDASSVRVVVDMNSLNTSYSDLTSTLVTSNWFNIKVFPTAEFKANHFTKIADDTYKADGTLTIRDKSQPVTLTFTAKESPKNMAVVQGTTTLKRSAFGVGQGEWASTSEVKDPVQVSFSIVAVKK